jgi:hypothetical protein
MKADAATTSLAATVLALESSVNREPLAIPQAAAGRPRTNPIAEHRYWREHYAQKPYVHPGVAYDQFAPAYQYGWESQQHHHAKEFGEVELLLKRDWERIRGRSQLGWHNAKEAVRDGWERGKSRMQPAGADTAASGLADQFRNHVEHAYWRSVYESRPYVLTSDTYASFAPAFEFGWQSHSTHPHHTFTEIERTLMRGWEQARGQSPLEWDRAKGAVRDAWNRVADRDKDTRADAREQ